MLGLFILPAVYSRFGAGQPGVSPELDLLHRWAGVEPQAEEAEVAAGVDGADGDGRTAGVTAVHTGEGESEAGAHEPAI